MNKYPLIGVSIVAMVLLVLGSLTNVVGYQSVQSSTQKVINDEVDQKELLFQTILDIANNREIQRLLLNSDMKKGTERSFDSGMLFSIFTPHVFTKKYLNSAYTIGLILTKTLSTSRIHSKLERYQVSYQGMQKEITAIIEENDTLDKEMNQLADVHCDCEKNNSTGWSFPVVCALLFPIGFFTWMLWLFSAILFHVELYYIHILWATVANIGLTLNCSWA